MWEVMVPAGSGSGVERSLFILPGQRCTVGRKNCDIVDEEKSISRAHATLEALAFPSTSVRDLAAVPRLIMTDTSRFGTWVHKADAAAFTCHKGESVELGDGDVVQFSFRKPEAPGREFKLAHRPLVLLAREGGRAGAVAIAKDAATVGAVVATEWSPRCTHVVSESGAAWGGILCAVLKGIPIVTPSWSALSLNPKLKTPSWSAPAPPPCRATPRREPGGVCGGHRAPSEPRPPPDRVEDVGFHTSHRSPPAGSLPWPGGRR
mmetsp:Transcript_45657/g.145403  ORF Transcript_45657/g.145403 Transcript_45657/m.145403 type:complete len:263 (-) Transcript_45657:1001-1789(-)